MPARSIPKVNLRSLILLFALLSALVTLGNSFWVVYRVQEQALVANALQNNQAFAARIAAGVEQVLSSDVSKLAYSAGVIGRRFDDPPLLLDEAARLLHQDDSFNSVLIADAAGNVIVTMPQSLQLIGLPLRDRSPLHLRAPLVSASFKSIAGNRVVFVSYPVLAANGEYLGLIGGTLQLGQQNALRSLLEQNVRPDAAYVYLVDTGRRLLYHPDATRVGEAVGDNPIIDAVLHGDSGAMQAHNSQDETVLAGYASVPSSHWGVVSQQSLATTLGVLDRLMFKVFLGVAPIGIAGMLLTWWLGARIARPLTQLADYARRLDGADSFERIGKVHASYFEAGQTRRALLLSAALLQEKIGRLSQQAQSDALTGLANRRAMEETLALWRQAEKGFAVVSMDIDHFKRVNDTFGHAAGDETLRAVAEILQQNSRAHDLPCRVGGEEFVLLLPGSSLQVAGEVAERLRLAISGSDIDPVGHITVSLGVALWTPGAGSVADAFKRADDLLYQAKQAGRNRVLVQRSALAQRVCT